MRLSVAQSAAIRRCSFRQVDDTCGERLVHLLVWSGVVHGRSRGRIYGIVSDLSASVTCDVVHVITSLSPKHLDFSLRICCEPRFFIPASTSPESEESMLLAFELLPFLLYMAHLEPAVPWLSATTTHSTEVVSTASVKGFPQDYSPMQLHVRGLLG